MWPVVEELWLMCVVGHRMCRGSPPVLIFSGRSLKSDGMLTAYNDFERLFSARMV